MPAVDRVSPVSPAQAAEIALRHYGVSGTAERLASEHDDTFRLAGADGVARLLKISAAPPALAVAPALAPPVPVLVPGGDAAADSTGFQTALLLHLARVAPELPVQRVIAMPDGRPEVRLLLDGSGGEPRLVRLTTWLDGELLGRGTTSVGLRREIGATLGRLNIALRGFAHPGARRTHQWDLQNFGALRPLLEQLPQSGMLPSVGRALAADGLVTGGLTADGGLRAALTGCLDRFDAVVRTALAGVPAQVIHTDFHGENLLTDGSRITGILDFGDALAGPVAMDVGVAACYQLGAGGAGGDLLAPAVDVVAGYHAVDPLSGAELDLVAEFMVARVAARIIVSQSTAARDPANSGYLLRRTPQAVAQLAALHALPSDEIGRRLRAACAARGGPVNQSAPLMVNGFDGSGLSGLPAATQELIARREAALGGAYRLFYERPVEFVRGSGVYLYDPDGVAYLDAYNNVPSVGHSHPRVTEAVSRQLATLNTHTRYLTDGVVGYAERLLATHTIGPAHAMFTCTGSEANDLALRIARSCTGGTGVIVTENAYHGVTAAVAELSPSLGANVPLGAHVRTVPAPARGSDFAAGVAAAIEDLRRHGLRLAAFLADSLFSSDGVLPDPAGLLTPVAGLVHAAGGLYIADEVQSGFGRTGSQLWGYQRHTGLTPDIVTMGKPMGNGLPIAGMVARQSVLAEFGRTARYFNTFGGNPVCVAAAATVLDVIADEGLQANSLETGGYLKDALTGVAAGSPVLADVRGAGLYLGVDVVSPHSGEPSAGLAAAIVNGMRDRHVLISATGPRGHVLKVRPPLPFARPQADQFLEALTAVLAARLDRKRFSGPQATKRG